MRPPRRPRTFIVPALLLSLCATAPAAAQLAVEGLAWGTPPPRVRAELEARGYRFRGVDDAADHVFGASGPAELVATYDSAGLVEVEVSWPGTPAQASRRFRALADSLRRALGPPGETGDSGRELTWARGGVTLLAIHDARRRAYGEAVTLLAGQGPGSAAERERRYQAASAESQRMYASGSYPPDTLRAGDWVRVAGGRGDEVLLDTVRVTAAAPGVYRVRIREEWRHVVRMLNGRTYAGEQRYVEIDCGRQRWRRLRTVRLAGGSPVVALPLAQPAAWAGWTAPAAATVDGRALRRSCVFLRGTAAPRR